MKSNNVTIKEGSKSFYAASLFLPSRFKRPARELYMICRKIDDVGDYAEQEGKTKHQVKREIDAIIEDSKTRDFLKKYDIPQKYLTELGSGVLQDLEKKRYRNFDELYDYCYLVAGTVGAMMCRLFGVKKKSVIARAIDLGGAMQLTNILRDIEEDLQRDLIFLPADELKRFGVSVSDIKGKKFHDGYKDLMQFQIARAKYYYQKGYEGIKYLPEDTQLSITLATFIYSGILEKIKQQNYDPYAGRAYLNSWEKLMRCVQLSFSKNPYGTVHVSTA